MKEETIFCPKCEEEKEIKEFLQKWEVLRCSHDLYTFISKDPETIIFHIDGNHREELLNKGLTKTLFSLHTEAFK